MCSAKVGPLGWPLLHCISVFTVFLNKTTVSVTSGRVDHLTVSTQARRIPLTLEHLLCCVFPVAIIHIVTHALIFLTTSITRETPISTTYTDVCKRNNNLSLACDYTIFKHIILFTDNINYQVNTIKRWILPPTDLTRAIYHAQLSGNFDSVI